MQEAVKAGSTERRLALGELVDWLIEDKLADAEAAGQFKKERRYYKGAVHPLAVIAEQKWKAGSKVLDLDTLSECAGPLNAIPVMGLPRQLATSR